jgi:PTS system cellobiose-specific IIA component
MNEQIVEKAMDIIMHAGDARLACKNSLDCLMSGNLEEAKAHMKEADAEIAQAHHVQTDCIQGAIAGEEFEYNVLFAHAQDTLMTIYSEIMIAKQLTSMYEKLDARVKALEEA